jgi:U3 small nucleolar RNA-associated protein 25
MPTFRQTVVFSAYKKAEVTTLVRRLNNHSGRVRITALPAKYGTMLDVTVSMRQRFLRIDGVATPDESPNRRFAFFTVNVLPEIRVAAESQALIVIPSYFDFVRVRNMLVELEADDPTFRFASMSEYSKASDVARARTNLFTGRIKLVIMTERFHYYWRNRIRGANTIVWYGLPENAQIYPEIVNFTAEAAERGRPVQSIAMYDVFDSFALERIVGESRSKKLTSPARSVYLFA